MRVPLAFLAGLVMVVAVSDRVSFASPEVGVGVESGAAPVAPGSSSRMRQLQPAAASRSLNPPDIGIVQRQNKRTGVTCTMRILKAKPTVDPGMLSPTPRSVPDPMVRDSLSPCVE